MHHPLEYAFPHPLPELGRSEHLDVRHPGKNPTGEFLAPGGREAHFQTAVPLLEKYSPVPLIEWQRDKAKVSRRSSARLRASR